MNCQYCNRTLKQHLKRHEANCYLNPDNIKLCKVCEEPIKNYRHSKGTCSHSCSNKHFKRTKPENFVSYRTICFHYHKKECIVCGENKIVTVHHNDGNHSNNEPENLIPLCPTHHQYLHSRHKDEVQPVVDAYIKERINSV